MAINQRIMAEEESNKSENPESESPASGHWHASLKLVAALLTVWFLVSYGCGILFRDWMDANMPQVGHAPFGFWMAQQGSIICFVILLITYNLAMNHLDTKYGYNERH